MLRAPPGRAPVDDEVAVTLRAALERAIEATFQLEDSELDSIELPDDAGRGRMLLTESAEGGAGVLGRLARGTGRPGPRRPHARSSSSTTTPTPATDLGQAPGARERCEKGCYDCLLCLRQPVRARQHRPAHASSDLLRDLMRAEVARRRRRTRPGRAAATGWTRSPTPAWNGPSSTGSREDGCRLPDDAQRTVSDSPRPAGLRLRPARQPGRGVRRRPAPRPGRPAAAGRRRRASGWRTSAGPSSGSGTMRTGTLARRPARLAVRPRKDTA